MITFQTSDGTTCLLDDEDHDLAAYQWYVLKKHGATRTMIVGRGIYQRVHLRNIIAVRKLGRELREDEECFNKNKDLGDCRRENILIGSRSQALAHSKKRANTSSPYKGVSLQRKTGKWTASIKIQGKTKWLGTYASPEEAAAAYNKFALELYGEYAWLNHIPSNNA